MTPAGRIAISIDVLDLTDVDPARRFQVAFSFERELTRLIERSGLPSIAKRGQDLELAVDSALHDNPVHLGVALARSVYEALS